MSRNLFFVAAALFLWGFGEGMFFNFVPIYLDVQFLLSKYQIGLILGAFGFSMAITHIPAGRLADRFGRRPLLIGAWLLGLVSTWVMGLSVTLPLFLVGLFAYGLTAFVASPLSSYVTAARGKWPVATVLSLTTATFGMGMVLGPVTGGWIGDHYGMRTSFYVAGAVFIFSNIFMALIEKQQVDHHDPDAPPPSLRDNQRFITLMGVLALAVFSMYFAQPLTPNFLEGVRGLSLSQTGLVFTVGALGNSLMAISFSRANPRKGFLLAQALVILYAVLIWKGTTLPLFALGYFLLGGFRAGRPMAMAQARELVHESQMGVTYGIMETISSVIVIITPPIAGYLFEIDPVIIYPLSIGMIVVSIFVSSIFLPRKVEAHV
ncbi:MAG TPA: MFS transporter [Anaerolineales bacterium]|nr:MFS transporter [Anaerolineales bacterium]HNO32102.1 MFS transporter [Anaerolineales bacterium]